MADYEKYKVIIINKVNATHNVLRHTAVINSIAKHVCWHKLNNTNQNSKLNVYCLSGYWLILCFTIITATDLRQCFLTNTSTIMLSQTRSSNHCVRRSKAQWIYSSVFKTTTATCKAFRIILFLKRCLNICSLSWRLTYFYLLTL